MLDLLANLVDKSLDIADVQGEEARYRLLETVRQYAAEKLAAAGEEAAARRRHLAWCRDLAVRSEPGLRGPEQPCILATLEQEHDNLRAALAWAPTDAESAAAGLHLGAALRLFWLLRGHVSEGRAFLGRLLAVAAGAPAVVRAQALDGAAALAHSQGDIAAARPLQEESLALWRGLGDARGLAVALNTLGLIVRSRGDFARALGLLEESLAWMRQAGNTWGAATVLNNLGATATEQGDRARARRYTEEGLAIKRELGDRAGMAVSLHNLAELLRGDGDLAQAAALFEESLALWRDLGSTPRIAHSLHSLGMVRAARGAADGAAARFSESLALFREADDRTGIAMCLEGLAALAVMRREHPRAARLLGAAERLREASGAPIALVDRPAYDRAVAAARAGLGEEPFRAAWAAGRALPPDEAAAEAAQAGRS